MTELDPRALREAFGAFLTGVTVVAARTPEGARHGFTANSFASVSLDPPLLLVCPSRRLSSFAAFENCAEFAVSILAEGQEEVSNIFAGFKGDRFAEVAWRPDANGVPLIDGAAAHFSCRTTQAVPAGDHIILIGEVTAFERTQKRGLGYAAGQYFSLGLERAAAAASAEDRRTIVGAMIERDGALLLAETPDGLAPPTIRLSGGDHPRRALCDALAAKGLRVDLGKAYSIFEDRSSGAQNIFFRAEAASAETGGLGVWVPIAAAARRPCASDVLRTILERYAFESAARNFNLYVGDDADGDIHAYE